MCEHENCAIPYLVMPNSSSFPGLPFRFLPAVCALPPPFAAAPFDPAHTHGSSGDPVDPHKSLRGKTNVYELQAPVRVYPNRGGITQCCHPEAVNDKELTGF